MYLLFKILFVTKHRRVTIYTYLILRGPAIIVYVAAHRASKCPEDQNAHSIGIGL